MSSISLSGLGWTTPDSRSVFRDLDMQFGRERAGLVGRNGVGKTTLLHIIAGDREPSAGRILIDGSVSLLRQAVRALPGQTIADLFGAALVQKSGKHQHVLLRRADFKRSVPRSR
jgi:ATPase subunit of ABC transporter with duplicated ATPase domains